MIIINHLVFLGRDISTPLFELEASTVDFMMTENVGFACAYSTLTPPSSISILGATTYMLESHQSSSLQPLERKYIAYECGVPNFQDMVYPYRHV